MARIAGVNIPSGKKLKVALTYIYGIGDHTALKICETSGADPEKRVNVLSDDEVIKIREAVSAYVVEGELRRAKAMDIKTLQDLKCYRGTRHILKLPVRGQRTRTNARTRKGGVRVPVAGKKKVTK